MTKTIELLSKELLDVGGKIFARYFLEIKGDDETKNLVKTQEFMLGMFNGEIKKEWKLEESEDYKYFLKLNNAIKILSNLHK